MQPEYHRRLPPSWLPLASSHLTWTRFTGLQAVNPNGTSQSSLATSSLNELRLDVKYNHDLRREQ
jgi:hypothetical protein